MKKKVIPAIIIIALIFIIGGIYALQLLNQRYSYSKEKADLNSYFDIKDDTDVAIIHGNEYVEDRAKVVDGTYYMDLASVKKYLNRRFYYGKADGTLIYTTPDAIITTNIGEKSYTSSKDGASEESYQITILDGDVLWVALDYVKKYTNFAYTAFTEPNRIQLDTSWEESEVATVAADTQLRVRGGVKSNVIEELTAGDKVVILEEMEKWSKVRSSDACIGYVENKKLKDFTTAAPIPVTDYAEPEYTSLKRDHKINLAFHNIQGPTGNDTLLEFLSPTKKLNVVSPTWLKIADNSGNILSYASSSYVKTAHDKGLEVWVLLDNFTGPKDFSITEVLSHAESRATLIKKAVDETVTCGADGINLDFEQISKEDGQSYIEFIRELSIACREAGLVFSIDDYVPMHFNDHYDIREQGIVADYVIIMGYDEHYNGSEAGSVASIGYVENGIANTIAKVDKSKVINALPFYTRLWRTKDGKVTSEALSMKKAKEFISNHSLEMEWDDSAAQYYGEFVTSDDTYTQIWMEDATSIEQKINVMKANDIGGVAAWSLGMETSDIWDVISTYVEG